MAINLIINKLDRFTKEKLTSINNTIKVAKSLNARFPVSWLTIDRDHQQLLYDKYL